MFQCWFHPQAALQLPGCYPSTDKVTADSEHLGWVSGSEFVGCLASDLFSGSKPVDAGVMKRKLRPGVGKLLGRNFKQQLSKAQEK